MIDCAICFQNRGDFYKSAYVALLSCFKNTASRLRVHLIIDDTVTPHRHHFEALCAEYGHELAVHQPPVPPADVMALFPGNALVTYTPASLSRLAAHEIIPADKLIYFDCDIVFETDIARLYDLDLGNAFLLATHDPSRRWSVRKKSYYLKALDIDERRYFNSGVLSLNLKALREASANGNVFWEHYKKLAPLAATLPYPIYDQDLLNAMLSRDEKHLLLTDASLNYELCLHDRRFYPPEALAGKILHFAALKPWQKFFPAHFAYWKYYAQSPWKDQTVPLMAQRFFDPADRYTQSLLALWRHPRLTKSLGALLRPRNR